MLRQLYRFQRWFQRPSNEVQMLRQTALHCARLQRGSCRIARRAIHFTAGHRVRVGHIFGAPIEPKNLCVGKCDGAANHLEGWPFHSKQCAIPSPKIFVETADGDEFNIYAKEVDYGSLSLTWLVLSFSLLSALFQGLRPFMRVRRAMLAALS